MKSIGVIYATREGHTAKIAQHVAAGLHSRGFVAVLSNLSDEREWMDFGSYDAVVIAASVHAGKHEPELIEFVKKHRVRLQAMQAAFLSVTLSEAGAERQDATPEEHARFQADVQTMIDSFIKETGWHPERVKPVAGALLYTKYNFLLRFIMKRISRKAGGDTDTSRDFDYTDWVDLDRFIDEFAERISQNAPLALTEHRKIQVIDLKQRPS